MALFAQQIADIHGIHLALLLALEQCKRRKEQEKKEDEEWEIEYRRTAPYFDVLGLLTGRFYVGIERQGEVRFGDDYNKIRDENPFGSPFGPPRKPKGG